VLIDLILIAKVDRIAPRALKFWRVDGVRDGTDGTADGRR
jgi:hypothetical protein